MLRQRFGVFGGYLVFLLLLTGCVSLLNHRTYWQRYDFSVPKMGTTFRISCYAPDSLVAAAAAEKAFAKVDELNAALSDYHPESELNQLSATAGSGLWVEVSEGLWEVLNLSLEASRQTNGAFDVTVGVFVKLWRRARMQQRLPSKELLAQAKQQMGYQHIRLDSARQAVMLEKEGMKLDLGGIAKGYTADQMLKVFKDLGLPSVLIDAGGDLVAGNPPPGQSGWEIAVEQGKGRKAFKISLSNQAVATSGDLYQFIELDGKRFSHIVDPFTGLGLQKQVAATVVARQGAQADYLASALCVMDMGNASQLARRLKKVHVYVTEWNEGELESLRTGIFLEE